MTVKELENVIQELIGRGRWLDRQKTRTNKLEDIDKTALMEYWRHGLSVWELGLLFDVQDEYIYDYLIRIGERPELHSLPQDEKYKRLSNRYHMFNGAFMISKELDKQNITVENLAYMCNIAKTTMLAIVAGRLLPTKQQIYKIADVLNIDVALWAKLSTDIDLIIREKIKDTTPRKPSCIIKCKDINCSKELLVRSQLAYARIYKGLSVVDMADILKIFDWQYINIETARDTPNIDTAKRLAKIFGLTYYTDLYIVDVMPINYEYIISQSINNDRLKLLAEYKNHYTSRIYRTLTDTSYNINNVTNKERSVDYGKYRLSTADK